MNTDKAIEIAPGIFWVGADVSASNLHCNAYLIIDGNEGLLIDPGSVLDFHIVSEKVKSILPIADLSSIAVLHQDPDVAGSVTLFEEAGFSGVIATSWRTSVIVVYYGIKSQFYILGEHKHTYTFRSGRKIEFLPAPYLHFPGAVMAYDPQSTFLFSGDLFGAFTEDWSLYADETYQEAMKVFHREYMPANEILRPVMEMLLTREIAVICPQHGSIIDRDIASSITTLRDLPCGLFLTDVRRNLTEVGIYSLTIELIIERLIATFGIDEVMRCFSGPPIAIDPQTGKLARDLEQVPVNPDLLWNQLFDRIYNHGGERWLDILEPLLERLSTEFPVRRPDIFYSSLIREKQKSSRLNEEKKQLESINISLQGNLELAMEEMTRDQVTGLYNENSLVKYLLNIFNEETWHDFAACFIQIDRMKQLNDTLGERKGDEVIASIGSLLFHQRRSDEYLFRVSGPVFVLISPPERSPEQTVERAEALRLKVSRERGFLEQVTISIGIVPASGKQYSRIPAPEAMESVFAAGRLLLRTAARNGGNRVETRSEETEKAAKFGRVVIVEYDIFHAQLLGDALEALSIDYRICTNGPQALETIRDFHPDVIVSELFLQETDAFTLKEELEANSRTGSIPFILVSHQKTESTIVRAINLEITHYVKKPYLMSELLGIINTYVLKAMQHA